MINISFELNNKVFITWQNHTCGMLKATKFTVN